MNNRSYIFGIIALSVIIIVSWLVSAFGSEKYTIVDMTPDTTAFDVKNPNATTTGSMIDKDESDTTTINN